jgi:hypothetical protein
MTLLAGGTAIFLWLAAILLAAFDVRLCFGCPPSEWLDVAVRFAPTLVFGVASVVGSVALLRGSWRGWWLSLAVNVVGLVWIIWPDPLRGISADGIPVAIGIWGTAVLCLLAPRTRAEMTT